MVPWFLGKCICGVGSSPDALPVCFGGAFVSHACTPDSQLPSHCTPLRGVQCRRCPPRYPSLQLPSQPCLNCRRDEGTFELSLFAEALHDALTRDAGAAVLAELYKQR